MSKKIIPQRVRYLLAGEGECEQAFVAFLNIIARNSGLHVHFDSLVLGGGGYRSMLESVKRSPKFTRQNNQSTILLVDTDRSDAKEDGWSLEKLRQEAIKLKIEICAQNPNIEGLYLRLLGVKQPINRTNIGVLMRREWPDYDRQRLESSALFKRISLNALIQTANIELELKKLLSILGFIN